MRQQKTDDLVIVKWWPDRPAKLLTRGAVQSEIMWLDDRSIRVVVNTDINETPNTAIAGNKNGE